MLSNRPLSATTSEARRIRVRGLVQGVGFRPTVWKLAQRFGLLGSVRNDGEGVLIEISGDRQAITEFVDALQAESPPLARIDAIEQTPLYELSATTEFKIIPSSEREVSTGVVADAATCSQCLTDLFDPENRRYRYPFTNCTHCGPRFSITQAIPYDRANTSMAMFELCESCADEYRDPADRRFHAQPNACADCGPRVWLHVNGNETAAEHNAIVAVADLLRRGGIVAIKGIGGFHFACDATNAQAVTNLRERKRRPSKPLALMARDLNQVQTYCWVDESSAETLNSPAAPVVLLDRLNSANLPEAIAPGQRQLGFMLPYSPLHHLLMAELDQPIVLTSGNRSEEPQCIDNDEALDRLESIADAFLLHDRPIFNRIDDSVVRLEAGAPRLLRRARGYAPGQLSLPAGFDGHPALLAMGGELKNTFCQLQDGHAYLSQHMGDLENVKTYEDYCHNLDPYARLFQHDPQAIAVDMHPDYLSTKLGRNKAVEAGLPLIEVQHHHAHVAACMADNDIALGDGPVLGIALDGLGYGDDGTLWGGEVLLADYDGYRRLACLQPVALPGASKAMYEPWRNTLAQLRAAGLMDRDRAFPLWGEKPAAPLCAMIDKQVNSPLSSSAGRLFDAVSWALGLAPDRISFEGEAAILLEAAIDEVALNDGEPYLLGLITSGALRIVEPAPMWRQMSDDLFIGVSAGICAARFHTGLARAFGGLVIQLAQEHAVSTVALTGGVFQNRTLTRLVERECTQAGLQVLRHSQVPANDGGLALGQALIAAATMKQE